jgi:hypothetical protein
MNEFLMRITEGHKTLMGVAPWFIISLLLFAGAGCVVWEALSRQRRGEPLSEGHGDRNLWMVLPSCMTAFAVLFFVLGCIYN